MGYRLILNYTILNMFNFCAIIVTTMQISANHIELRNDVTFYVL